MDSAASPHDYSHLREQVAAAVAHLCPGWLSDQRDDLVQLAVLRIHRRYDTAELNRSFLYRVAHSVIIDEIRKHKRRNEVGMTPTTPDRIASPRARSPERVSAGHKLGEHISACLSELSDDRRRAVTLYLQGHSVPEAAQLLDFSRKKTENLVYRGLADLRKHLKARGIEP
jgi:RNA polymerase sigma-70 factor (ECF subfamily)